MTSPPPAGPPGGYAVPPGAAPLQPPGYPPYGYLPTAPNGMPLADFGQRLLAYLLDTLVVTLVASVLTCPLYVWWVVAIVSRAEASADAPGSDPTDPFAGDLFTGIFLPMLGLLGGVFVAVALVTYVYQVELMFRTGQTIGKRVMKLRVMPLDPAETLTRGHAARRWLVQWGGGTFIPFFSYLDGLWQLWDKPYRQCLHDKVPRTVVVKIPG